MPMNGCRAASTAILSRVALSRTTTNLHSWPLRAEGASAPPRGPAPASRRIRPVQEGSHALARPDRLEYIHVLLLSSSCRRFSISFSCFFIRSMLFSSLSRSACSASRGSFGRREGPYRGLHHVRAVPGAQLLLRRVAGTLVADGGERAHVLEPDAGIEVEGVRLHDDVRARPRQREDPVEVVGEARPVLLAQPVRLDEEPPQLLHERCRLPARNFSLICRVSARNSSMRLEGVRVDALCLRLEEQRMQEVPERGGVRARGERARRRW